VRAVPIRKGKLENERGEKSGDEHALSTIQGGNSNFFLDNDAGKLVRYRESEDA
jgi:hypothetical protein